MKLFLQNKKGSADTYVTSSKWYFYILVIFIVSFMLILFVGKGFSFVQSKATTPINLEEDLVIAQLVNVCFSYEEESGPYASRVFQNTLDIKKLLSSQLDGCVIDSVSVTISSIYSDFETISLRADKTTVRKIFSRYVLVKDGDKLFPATMTVTL